MQLSGSGIGDEPAIISQVTRDVPRQRPVNKRDDLKVDALPHRKPVQLTKHWCDVITSSRAGAELTDRAAGAAADLLTYYMAF